MPRTLNASTEAELDNPVNKTAYLITLNFSPIIRLCSLPFDFVYDSNTYTSSRQLRRVGDVSESAELRVGSTSFQFGGADQTYLSLILNNDYIGVEVQYWRILLDSSNAVIGDHIVIFDGEISGANFDRSDNDIFVEIACANHFANWGAISGRRSTDTSQQSVFDGDTCARMAPDTVKDVPWGRA